MNQHPLITDPTNTIETNPVSRAKVCRWLFAAVAVVSVGHTAMAQDLYTGERYAPSVVKAFCADIGGTYVKGAGCAVSYIHGPKSLNPRIQNSICRTVVERGPVSRAKAEAVLRATCAVSISL